MLHPLINHYRAIESTSAQMLAFAAVADWACLVDCEQRCRKLIRQLGIEAQRSRLTPEQRQETREIMVRILRIDAQIRNHAEPSAAQYAHLYHRSMTRALSLLPKPDARKDH